LRNQYSQIVAVQSKRYASDVHVPSKELRDFGYALHLHGAVYGYFVTTSTFTDDARWVIQASHDRIRPIDGPRLDSILRHRVREVGLAMIDIRNSIRG
jgi:restriction endonuclease Mrr